MAFVAIVGASVQAQTTNGGDDGASTAAAASSVSSGTTSNGSDDGASTGATTGSTGSTGTVTNGSDDGVSHGGTTSGTGGTGTITNGDDDAAGSSNPSNPGNPGGPGTITNGGSTGGTSGGTSGGGNSTTTVPVGPAVLGAAATSCPLLTTHMKLGWNNNGAEVAKLQAFLKTTQGADVQVTGIFDIKTDAAVRAFQKKYLADVMGPWDATRASGFVYITTVKKINELVCASPLTLTAAELSIINSYKQNLSADGSAAEAGPTFGADSTTTPDGSHIIQGDQDDNVAAVGGSSIFSRFWAFIVSLFK